MPRFQNLSIFWYDTRKLLTKKERKELEFNGEMIVVGQNEVQVIDRVSERRVIIRGSSDIHAVKSKSLIQ